MLVNDFGVNMIAQTRSFPEDFGVDYCLMMVNINKYPAYLCKPLPETGEMVYEAKHEPNPLIHELPLLIDPSGMNVVPVNLYLHSLLSNPNVSSVKTIESYAAALLSFYRWMRLEIPEHNDPISGVLIKEKRSLTIYDCTDKVEESPVVGFRDYLLENVYTKDENGKISGSPSTASNYVLKVIAYYTYLHRHRIIQCSESFRPFEFEMKSVHIRSRTEKVQHEMLSHMNGRHGKKITAYTTGLTKPFKNIQKPMGANIRELNPLREDEKKAFYLYLDVESSTDTKNLMLYLKAETGLRLEELITFPASVVDKPKATVVKVPIGERINGCLTKFKKERIIEIPSHVMELLYEYKLSKARTTAIESGLFRHERLFVQSNGNIYAPNTIQKHVEKIRNELVISGLDIYFATHDLRATFATDWLYNKHIETGKLLEALMSELADLMGHESTATTQKYINYMNDDKTWTEFAQRKNQYSQQVLR